MQAGTSYIEIVRSSPQSRQKAGNGLATVMPRWAIPPMSGANLMDAWIAVHVDGSANSVYGDGVSPRYRLEAALEKIAVGVRPDGTYNLSREACEQIARKALGL